MNVAVFGGSFDPPHMGHLAIVQKALERLDIDLLFVVPTYLNPFKSSFAAPPTLRLRWLKKIFLPYNKVQVLGYEIAQKRPVYAIETVEYLRRRYAPRKIYYLIGSDNAKTLHRWKDYRRLKKRVEFIVFHREGYERPTRLRQIRINVPISSTQLRTDPKRRYLPPPLRDQISRFYRRAVRARRLRSGTFGDRPRS